MKIVVMGGSGLIGSKLVTKLRDRRHETLAASPASGVNMVTGQGLAAALEGASVVVDVSNSPPSKTRGRWSSSGHRPATCSPPSQPLA